MWIEQVFVPSRRETVMFQCPPVGTNSFEGDPTRVNIKLIWQFPGSVAAGDTAQLAVQTKNISGALYNATILGISQSKPSDEMSVEHYGDLLTRQFTVTVTSAQDATVIITTLKRESARLETIGG